jgi:hypothetical protein
MGIWIYRTNADKEIDPDWGTKSQISNCIYKVIVEPKKGRDWIFFLILPSDGYDQDDAILCQQGCENFLGTGDKYTVAELGVKDIEEFTNAIPVLCYSPFAPGEFIWMTPPDPIKN